MDLEISVREQIKMLPPELMNELVHTTLDRVGEKFWCEPRGIDYLNPDFVKSAEIVFIEKYPDRIPGLFTDAYQELRSQ